VAALEVLAHRQVSLFGAAHCLELVGVVYGVLQPPHLRHALLGAPEILLRN